MEICLRNSCEELYWETAKMAVEECKLVALGALRLCCSMFRCNEEKALEERYGHLFTPYGEGNIGEKILDRMVALSIPAYGNNLRAVEDMLGDPYHSELNAHYYFQTGRVLVEDYVLPVFDWEEYHELRDWDMSKAIAMWEAHEEKKRAFFLSIAESIWDFSAFAEENKEFLTAEEVDAYHNYCKKIFIEDRIFLQPEWLLFSCAKWQGKEDFLYNNPRTEFFLQAHEEEFALLPEYVRTSKAFKNYHRKNVK